nr:uncharacterized protein LOC121124404 [Lepeophtheirus salmonis]
MILDIHETFTLRITPKIFSNFYLGGFIRKPKTVSKLYPFQGYITRIMSFSLEINLPYTKNLYSIMDDEHYNNSCLFNLNGSDYFHYLGKYVSWNIIQKYEIEEIPPATVLKLMPTNFQLALENCRHIDGKMVFYHNNESEYKWYQHKKKAFSIFHDFKWDKGEPNGRDLQNCVVYNTVKDTFKDEYCYSQLSSYCCTLSRTQFILRGIPTDFSEKMDNLYFLKMFGQKMVFYGYEHTIIKETRNSMWVIASLFEKNKPIAFNNQSINYPWGKNTWFFIKKSGNHVWHEGIQLKLTRCSRNEFSCDNGTCIDTAMVCNSHNDCYNSEDEMNCSLIYAVEHQKENPPFISSNLSKTYILLKFHLKSINKIQEFKNSLDLSFDIILKWKDSRISFNHLRELQEFPLTEEEKNKIWIPAVIFENLLGSNNKLPINRYVQISALRDTNATWQNNPMSFLLERLIFKGSDVTLILKTTKKIQIYCAFDFHDYPFDTQTCTVEIGLSFHIQDTVAFLVDEDSITYDNIDHLQYDINDMQLKLVNSTGVVYIQMRRILYSIIWTTYIPTFSLQIVAIITLFFPPNRFDITVNITITTTLVIYTLYQSVSTSLPPTTYHKMIDYWLIFSLIMPFFVFILEMLPELQKPKVKKVNIIYDITIRLLSKYGKFVIITVTILFDIGYWLYNFSNELIYIFG